MEENKEHPPQGYAVPTYFAPPGTIWYHFLHGNVPGHQIDFIYRPEVPQGPLSRQHFSHLSRLMKYIEPQEGNEYAFAIANLSRDDTQYEAGHGGLAMIFGLRIRGVTDHVGRQDPPFAHGIALVDRRMDYTTLLSAAVSFHEHMFGRSGIDSPSGVLYREYVRYAADQSESLSYVLRAYAAQFTKLPSPPTSSLSLQWVTGGATQPRRIVIVHPDGSPFGDIAECAARIAAVLYQSDIRWTAITTGRESDVPGGVTIRFSSRGEAPGAESGAPILMIDDVPEDQGELARKLFGAKGHALVAMEATGPVGGWRERYKRSGGQPPLSPSDGDYSKTSEPDAGRRGSAEKRDYDDPPASGPGTAVPQPGAFRVVGEGARPWAKRPIPEGLTASSTSGEPPVDFKQRGRSTPAAIGAAQGGAAASPPREQSPTATMTLEPGEIEFVDDPSAATPSPTRAAVKPISSTSEGAAGAAAIVGPAGASAERTKQPSGSEIPTAAMAADRARAAPPPIDEASRPARSRLWVWIALATVCAVIIPVAYFAMSDNAPDVGALSASSSAAPPALDSDAPPAKGNPAAAASQDASRARIVGTVSTASATATEPPRSTGSGKRPSVGIHSPRKSSDEESTIFDGPLKRDKPKPRAEPPNL